MILQRVHFASTSYTKSVDKNGRTRYRKEGRFVSEQRYNAAFSSRYARHEILAETLLVRAGDKGARRAPRTQWILKDPDTRYGRAGKLGAQVLGVRQGHKLTAAQRRAIIQDMRLVHGFETYWHFMNPDLTRGQAEQEFLEMISRIEKARNAKERDDIREEYGLDRVSSGEAT